MRRLRELILRFGGLFNKQRKDRELEEEIESHVQMHIEDNLRLGMTPEEARRQTMIQVGRDRVHEGGIPRPTQPAFAGDAIAGHSVRRAAIAQELWLHCGGRAHARDLHWSQSGYLRSGRCHPRSFVALSGPRPVGGGSQRRSKRRDRTGSGDGGKLLGTAQKPQGVQVCIHVSRRILHGW